MDTNQNNEQLEELNINEQTPTTEEAQTAETSTTEETPAAVEETPAAVEETPAAETTPAQDAQTNNDQIEETTVLEPIEDTETSNTGAEALDNYAKAEKKGLKIAILVFLLVLDIAALVIYLIGIDKVLSFIK